ncbi:eCIS core domain-containing protein [Enterovibrio baiacu]|uniref:eCIS core domain-containing protein n=1 Tax=Enterovibrio baiacu TaxID=2491023 RepID=UPI003D14C6E4
MAEHAITTKPTPSSSTNKAVERKVTKPVVPQREPSLSSSAFDAINSNAMGAFSVGSHPVGASSAIVQRKCACGNAAPQGGTCGACAAKAAASPLASNAFLSRPSSSTSSVQAGNLSEALRARAEQTFGTALPDVNIHTGAKAQTYASALQAKAFTTGSDVYFGAGFYQPNTTSGLQLIGHELTHVMQQRRGLSFAKLQGTGDAYEKEADRGGEAFAARKAFQLATPSGPVGRWAQRDMDASQSAQVVGMDDPAHDLEFLGEAFDQDELQSLFDGLREYEDAQHSLYLIPESAIDQIGGDPAPSSNLVSQVGAIPNQGVGVGQDIGTTGIAQAKALDGVTHRAEQLLGGASGQPRVVQRAVVAGCNVPAMTMGQIGIAAHRQIGGFCGLLYQAISPSTPCLGNGHPGFQIPGSTRPDMVKQYPPTGTPLVDELGEIKPASWLNGRQVDAEAQLNRDLANYRRIIGTATTMWSYAFPTMPFVANPLQDLSVWPPTGGATSNGVYYYRCRNTQRRRAPRRIRIRIHLPVPVVLPQPQPVPRVVPQPQPQPLPQPQPQPQPQTPRPTNPVTPPTQMPDLRPVAGAAAAVGIGYLIYRGIRMIPSLAPPLWWTAPANLAMP